MNWICSNYCADSCSTTHLSDALRGERQNTRLSCLDKRQVREEQRHNHSGVSAPPSSQAFNLFSCLQTVELHPTPRAAHLTMQLILADSLQKQSPSWHGHPQQAHGRYFPEGEEHVRLVNPSPILEIKHMENKQGNDLKWQHRTTSWLNIFALGSWLCHTYVTYCFLLPSSCLVIVVCCSPHESCSFKFLLEVALKWICTLHSSHDLCVFGC